MNHGGGKTCSAAAIGALAVDQWATRAWYSSRRRDGPRIISAFCRAIGGIPNAASLHSGVRSMAKGMDSKKAAKKSQQRPPMKNAQTRKPRNPKQVCSGTDPQMPARSGASRLAKPFDDDTIILDERSVLGGAASKILATSDVRWLPGFLSAFAPEAQLSSPLLVVPAAASSVQPLAWKSRPAFPGTYSAHPPRSALVP